MLPRSYWTGHFTLVAFKATGGAQRPDGIGEQRSPEDDEVGLIVGDDRFGQIRAVDQADGASQQAGVGFDGGGEGHLVAGMDGDLLPRVIAAGGAIDQIDVAAFRPAMRQRRMAVVERPAAVHPIGTGDAQEERQIGGPGGARGGHRFEQQADAIFEAAAVIVVAGIAERRKKLVEQVAVGAVDLEDAEAGGAGAIRRPRRTARGTGRSSASSWRPGTGQPSAKGGADGPMGSQPPAETGIGLPPSHGPRHGGFAAGVSELNGGNGVLGRDEIDHAAHAVALLVVPEAEAMRRDAAARFGVDGFGEDDAGAAGRAGAQMGEMPIVHEAIGGGVLAHRARA